MLKKYYSYCQQLGILGSAKRLSQKIYHELSSLKGFPQSVHIEISNVCNLNCEYCVLKTNMNNKTILTTDMFDMLKPYFKYISNFTLSGIAEPLMNENLISFIKCIKKEQPLSSVAIFSNATLLNREMSEQMIDCGLDGFRFSLDGVDSVTVDSIRKGSTLATVLENIKVLRDLKKEKKSQKPVVYATTVLQRKNYLQLPQIVELAADLGIMRLNFNHLEPYNEEVIPNVLWYKSSIPVDLAEVLDRCLELAAKKDIYLGIAGFFPETPKCNEVFTPVILANGDVVPCTMLAYDRERFFQVEKNNLITMKKNYSRRKCFGNIKDNSLSKIWFSHEYVQFREKVLNGDYIGDCRYCLIKHNCICVRPGPTPESVVSELKQYTMRMKNE